MLRTFLLESLNGREHGEIILEWILWKQVVKVWVGCSWLRIGSSGGLFWT
jgi:hypothetical protein